MNLKALVIPVLIFFNINVAISLDLRGKDPDPDTTQRKYYNWYNLDPSEDKIYGVSTEKAYNQILKNKKSKPVIVAVIDSGVDVDHEDLKGKVWINEDEIPNNGVDDDHNGYIDDVNGWNFLGNSKGENIDHETLEITRLYLKYSKVFKDKKESDLRSKEKKEYEQYLRVKKEYEAELEKAQEEISAIKSFETNIQLIDQILKEHLKKDSYSLEELRAINTEDQLIMKAKDYLVSIYDKGYSPEMFDKIRNHYSDELKYHLNVDFNPRTIIGDDPENTLDSLYGNNNVIGERADHGTHVAGIIAANRVNDLGIKGIADNVKIMTLRAVPDGDERDKDIANAIKYAVNNGANIINMSFGKSYSPQKEAVDAAIKKAEKKGVLVIHAAGNDSKNIDVEENFPNNKYLSKGKTAKNWMTIGASSIEANEEFIGAFSNYGKQSVDLFAPGVNVYSLKPQDKYELNSGTSMACPVVSGVAAMVLSYYPQLNAEQLKAILIKSSLKYNELKVNVPVSGEEDKQDKSSLDKLSVSGGVVNAYEAIKLAEEFLKSNHKILKY